MAKEVEKVYDEWIAALRSGEYLQGTGQLKFSKKSTTSHCCLGVLCEIQAKRGIGVLEASTILPWEVNFINRSTEESWDFTDNIPVSEVTNSVFLEGNEVSVLWKMNDIKGKTFLEIAEYLEKEIKPKAIAREASGTCKLNKGNEEGEKP